MLFNSLHFAIFLPLVAGVYFALPYRVRWIFLLFASYYFYMAWNPAYIILIVLTTMIDYGVSMMMARSETQIQRRRWLYISLASNLSVLFFFKYYNFFNDTFRALFIKLGIDYPVPDSHFLLPVGISFYTFQALSYTIDVYRGDLKAERNPAMFALFVSYFPQLVAGPIERATNLMPQLHLNFDYDYKRVSDGLKMIAWGLFKKVVIADRVSVLVDYVYADQHAHQGPALALATVLFAWQVYCDFSGYSDIAVGAAQIMGHKLMMNFDRPFASRSLGELWRRWHISLSSWFRDYLYIPLGGSRVSTPRHCFNLFLVFTICGLWHGAGWNFVLWGSGHGLCLALSIATIKYRKAIVKAIGIDRLPGLYKAFQIGVTFFLFCFLLGIFRSGSLASAWYFVSHLFTGWGDPLMGLSFRKFIISLGMKTVEEFYMGVGAILILELVQYVRDRGYNLAWLNQRPVWFRWTLYYALVMIILNFGVFNSSPFFYFQF